MKDIRICFIGDSFVNGTGDETSLGWAGRLCVQANKNENNLTYYNLGIRRNTSHDIIKRLKNEISSRLSSSIDSRIVLSFGVNDTVIENGELRVSEENTLKNFEEIINSIQSDYKVIMVGPPPINNKKHNSRISILNNALKIKAKKIEIPFIELFSHIINDEKYKQEITKNDGTHPSSIGYKKIAKIISSSENWWF